MFHIMSPGKCKLKQRDATTHLLKWPKSGTLTTLNAGEDVKQRERSYIAGGDAKWYSHFGRYKTKLALTIQPSNHTPWYLPKGAENLYIHKSLHTDVYNSFIHNCQNLGATKISFSR